MNFLPVAISYSHLENLYVLLNNVIAWSRSNESKAESEFSCSLSATRHSGSESSSSMKVFIVGV